MAAVCPTASIEYQALSQADLVVLGTWTDGIFVVGQRPGRVGRLRKLPALAGKQAVAYCTFALNPGHTLDKMAEILTAKGADTIGGYAIHRRHIADGSKSSSTALPAPSPCSRILPSRVVGSLPADALVACRPAWPGGRPGPPGAH